VPGIGAPPVEAGFLSVKGILQTYFGALGISERVSFAAIDPARAPYLHPGMAAAIKLDGNLIGVAGELHPMEAARLEFNRTCALFELDFAALANYRRPPRTIQPPPRFPAVRRDLAIVLDHQTPAAEVLGAVARANQPWLESAEIFDVYTGEGVAADKKSVALSMRYRSPERTLTDEEVNRAHQELVATVLPQLNAQMRQ
jgi:phenylalanyl-tRNA synthetase beta chain